MAYSRRQDERPRRCLEWHRLGLRTAMTSPTPPPYKALREALGLSQRAVERELGWSTGRLSVIERGLVPSEEERRQLLAFLNDRLTEEVTR